MKKDKFKIYGLEILLLIILLFALFMPNIFNRVCLAIFLLLYALLVKHAIKKRNITSIYKRDVTITLILFAIIYLIAFYLLGIFVGFYKNVITFKFSSIYKYIIPMIVIIISSETIRSVFLSQEKAKLSKILITSSMILIDLMVYVNIYNVNSREVFTDVIGFSFFASISCNLLYNYISSRYGNKGVIIYRLITVLYAYIIPIIPDVYVFFRSVFRIIYPYIIYLVIDYSFKKRNVAMEYMDSKKRIVSLGIATIIIFLVVMLISCKFRYGVIVVGSGSMTGALDVGDVVVFENYKSQKIKKDDVIIFNRDDIKYIHRVVKISLTNGEYRYYTKGDANLELDDGFVTKSDMVGVTKLRIKYIGYPSILLRNMFDK